MSYLVYINGILVATKADNEIAQTRQVNDIARLNSREANHTYSVKIPKTAQTIKAFEYLGLPGNVPALPYQKNTADIIDTDTGHHLVYKGWADIIESNSLEYVVSIKDGSVDFFKAIENRSLADINLDVLNHSKNLTTVAASWSNPNSPYVYILANYNGKIFTDTSQINIDYLVPSVRTSWVWDKVFDYFGFEYEGEVFANEKFLNHFITYPNPVATEDPTLEEVAQRDSFLQVTTSFIPPATIVTTAQVTFFEPSDFDPAYYNAFSGIADAGLYRFDFTDAVFQVGSLLTSRVILTVLDSTGAQKLRTFIAINGGAFYNYSFALGDRFLLQLAHPTQDAPLWGSEGAIFTGSTTTTFSKVTGFNIDFGKAFADLKVTEFVREIMVNFGLTPFKDKYTNTIKFLTLDQLFQNGNVQDLSDKVVRIGPTKYSFGNYAKSNIFKYKHNDERDMLFDGQLRISDENLPEQTTVHASVLYAPEVNSLETFLGSNRVYKMYEREVKDDNTVKYKDLSGRYYVMRQERRTSPAVFSSDVLADTITVTTGYPVESFWRLPYNEVISDWQASLGKILNKAQLVSVDMWLHASDVFNFDFSRLAYLRQTGQYYLVNKINAFQKGKATKVDLVPIDYFTAPTVDVPNPTYTVVPGTPTLDGCQVSVPITTDYPGTFTAQLTVQVTVFRGEFGVFAGTVIFTQLLTPIPATYSAGVVTFDVDTLPANAFGYKFRIDIVDLGALVFVSSPLTDTVVLDGACYVPITFPSTLSIETATDQGVDPTSLIFSRLVRIVYGYTGIPPGFSYTLIVEAFGGFWGGWFQVGGFIRNTASDTTPPEIIVSIYNSTKVRLKINAVTSAEKTIS